MHVVCARVVRFCDAHLLVAIPVARGHERVVHPASVLHNCQDISDLVCHQLHTFIHLVSLNAA